MIDFKPLDLTKKAEYDHFLMHCGQRGCEYSFSNLFLWGQQRAAFLGDNLVFFSHFIRQSVYLFPVCHENCAGVLDAIIADAAERGITCRLTSLSKADCQFLEAHYPGRFQIYNDRDGFDYIYAIEDLCELKGRKFQRKRNHLNKFKLTHPGYSVESITDENTLQVQQMLDDWYASRMDSEDLCELYMEQIAIQRALQYRKELEMEGLILTYKGEILAMTLGSFLTRDTFDVQFEKAVDEAAYVAINHAFANDLHQKYPFLKWLNREDDLGMEGLRKAKLSYCPAALVEKCWARLWEEEDDH